MVANSGEMKYIAYYCPSFDPGAATQVLTVCTLQYSEEYSREGNLTAVLGADDRVFFSMDDCLYSYSLTTESSFSHQVCPTRNLSALSMGGFISKFTRMIQALPK